MPKYRMEVTLEFDCETVLPEIYVRGNAETIENVFDSLPEPEDFNWETAVSTITMKPIV